LSNIEKKKILGWTDEVLNKIPKRMKSSNNTLEKLTIELQKTEDVIKKAPSDEVVGPLINELNSINREIGNNETVLKQIDENIRQLQYKLKNSKSQIENLKLEARNHEKLQRGISLAQKVQVALEEYEIRLKKEKIGQLSQSLLDCLNELMHKEEYHGVVINPETFAVTLYDAQNHAIPKEQLSAGEKQIYAIAILWALARTSGRPLPFIVDTPLGRLDSDHRLNLVQNFFPVASHQVIVFSTDTEIDQKYFEDLSGNISKSYKLDYDREEGRTKIEPGYFWRMKEKDLENKQNKGLEQQGVPIRSK
jgi:DNA sulfur modification protein DndD